MKRIFTRTLLFLLFSISFIIYLQSCSTIGKTNGRNDTVKSSSPADSLAQGTYIIEGVVHDYAKVDPSLELETNSPTIFFLDNYFWVSEAPSFSINYIFLENIDIAYLNKHVRIVGIIQNAPSSYYVSIQNPLNIRMYVSKIEVMQ